MSANSYRNAAELAAAVLALPQGQLWHLFDQLVGQPEVVAAGWHIAERRISPRPNAERDVELVHLNDGGLSYADIGRAKNMTPAAVAKAVQRERRRRAVDNESVSTGAA